jgi:hypothetical protein
MESEAPIGFGKPLPKESIDKLNAIIDKMVMEERLQREKEMEEYQAKIEKHMKDLYSAQNRSEDHLLKRERELNQLIVETRAKLINAEVRGFFSPDEKRILEDLISTYRNSLRVTRNQVDEVRGEMLELRRVGDELGVVCKEMSEEESGFDKISDKIIGNDNHWDVESSEDS